MPKAKRASQVVGWREWVTLPELGAAPIKAKVDTGARTSALHAFHMRLLEVDGVPSVRFELHPRQRSKAAAVQVTLPVVGWKRVRSSSGDLQERPVIRTEVELHGQRWPIDVTLTNRDEMGFRMLIGRSAIRRRFLVDPGRSFLGGEREQG